jgi:hypothetical protein
MNDDFLLTEKTKKHGLINTISMSVLLISIGTFFIITNHIKNTNNDDNCNNHDDNNHNNIIDDEQQNLETVKQSKMLGYDILLSTMEDYIDTHKDRSFDNFMRKMWVRDYEIMIESRNNNEGFMRDYSEWKYLFEMMIPLKELT